MSLTLSETLEAPLLRVPFESLKRAAKDRKALIDELSDHLASLKHPQQSRPSEPKGPGSSSQPPADPSGDTEMEDAAAGEGVSGREASIERLRLLLSQLQVRVPPLQSWRFPDGSGVPNSRFRARG